MSAYSSTLAPIRRLPSEILRTVFREVQISLWWNTEDSESDSESESEDYQMLAFSRGPWKLSHARRAWRDIVLSYPQLWLRIVLRFGASPTETLRHTTYALQAMILRSTQHPLDVVFELEDDENEDAAIQAFPVLLEESCRWRSATLKPSLTLLEQLKVVRGKIPWLESLTTNTTHILKYNNKKLPEDVRNAFIDAPRLRKVALRHTYGLGDFIFPLHITHLATYMGNVSNLEAYRSLIECHFAETTLLLKNSFLAPSTFPMSDASLYHHRIYFRICAYLP
ncbi:hypothetical protein EV421DRAFT_913965 [Armillaria borealis]|uniref:F-box domain-containing protein n=1 Tax=Armillaria borealis TaxID=47425 RepID=A0AA39N054_9AGAR|nr:hypothetical protein EV421DRAFT_913965 [Armillaria borealis]